MGSCVWCCWAGLLCCHGTSIVSGWWSSRQQRCKDACGGTESCGEDCIRLCVLCTQSALGRTGFRRHRRRDRRACCRCGRPGLPRAQEGQSKVFEDGKCVGSGGVMRQTKGHCGFNTSSFTWTLQLFVAGLSVGSAPVLFIGRGRHGRIRHQPDLTWVCWWRQVTEEEVHLCRAAAVWTSLVFFYCLGDVGEAARRYFFRWRVIGLGLWVQIGTADGKVLLWMLCDGGSGARRRDANARIRAARPSHYLWPTGCSGRERGVRQTAMKAV